MNLFSFILFTFFLNLILSSSILSPNTYAYNLSVSADDVSIDIVSGKTSIKEATVGITSDCRLGYDFSIATSTSPALYLGGDNTIEASFSAVDGTNTLVNSSNQNKWGYYFNANSSTAPTDSNIFSPLSTTSTSLLTTSDTTSSSDINVSHSIYYGVNAGSSITPGSYKMGSDGVNTNGTIDYFVTMHPTCNTVDIAYDGNNADEGTMGAVGTGVIHTGVKDGDSVDLIASNFSRTGYGFAGWSVDSNAGAKLIDNDSTNNPTVYGPQETITLPDGFSDNDTDADGIVKLYAVWIPSQGDLQGWTGCANLDTAAYDSTTGALDITKNSVTALTDMRDHDTYAVARLADGKCWMIENLRLDAEATRGNNQYDPSVTNEFLAQGYNKYSGTGTNYGSFVGLADAEGASLFTYTTTANSLYSTDGSNGTINIDNNTGNAGSRFPRYNNYNTSSRASDPTTNSDAMYSYGNYYNWMAAIADTAYYTSNGASITNTSICPTGWRLPQGGNKTRIENYDDNDFWNHIVNSLNGGINPTNYNSSTTPYYTGTTEAGPVGKKLRSYPNNFVHSGDIPSSSVDSRGVNGLYWSSTVNSSNYAYYSTLGSVVYPGTFYGFKYYGWTIRCIASDVETFALSYNANGGTGSVPATQTTTANGLATFTVGNTTPARSGYTFAGWIDENGNEAQPGGTFRTKDTDAVLYARWANNSCNPSATTIGTGNSSTDAVCLQDVTPSMKSSLATATSSTGIYNLIDARDGQSYTVAKLPDGNLWLTKNLNYGSSSDTLLTSYDTDLPSNTTFMAPASTSTFSTGSDYYTTPQIQSNVTTYGGYYSYASAIASKDAYGTYDQNITTSICPKGWDLPTSASYTSLKSSANLTNYATASVAPYSFTYGGYKNGANFTSQTTRGDLWTSTNLSESYGQELYTTSAGFNVLANNSINYKYYGKTVRCIASNGTATVNYNANGGSGTMASQSGDINSISISSNTFNAPTGYQFKNWNTAANGSGTTVAVSTALSSIASNGDTVTLYAQWDPVYKITYVNNCATFNTGCNASTSNGTSTQNIILVNNPSTGTETGTLKATNAWTQTNYKIASWNTSADGTGTSYVPSSTYTVPAGSVPGDGITLYAQWTPKYTVVFDGNGADNEMTGMRNSTSYSVKFTNVAENDEIELLPSNYYKTGYGFAGWSVDYAGSTMPVFGPSQTTTLNGITAGNSPGNPGDTITLYAIWVQSTGYLQDFTGSDCQDLIDERANDTTSLISNPLAGVTALEDKRDGNVYTVGALDTDQCWMMENLRLNNNSTTPNWGDDSLSQGFGGAFIGLAASESTNFGPTMTANTLYSTTNITGSSQFPRYNNSNTASLLSNPSRTRNYMNATSPSNSGTYETSTIYSYGNYYTWNAAMASTEELSSRAVSEAAGTSICPAGWRLPTGGNYNTGTNEFYDLTTIISNTEPETGSAGAKYWDTAANTEPVLEALKKFPNNFVYSGNWSTSSANLRGSGGNYWSTSAYDINAAYQLSYTSTRIKPVAYDPNRFYGASVRCLISPPKITDLTYMQDFASLSNDDKTSVLNSMTTDQQYQLTDSRDGKVYWISKLQDGHVWMTQNLDLDLGVNTLTHNSTTLYHDDTDLGWGSDTTTTSWTPANATETVTYDSNMKGTFTIYTGITYASIPQSLDVGDWYYVGYDGSTFLTSTTVDYITSDNRTKINDVVIVNDGGGNDYFSTAPFAVNGAHGHVGNYYNWTAAIASNDSSSYNNTYGSTLNDTSYNPQNSICPAGWRLPTITSANPTYDLTDSKDEFARLSNLYASYAGDTNISSAGLEASPLFFVRGGFANNGKIEKSGDSEYYWSSTVRNGASAYSLNSNSTSISPQKVTGRNYVNSVRCLVR